MEGGGRSFCHSPMVAQGAGLQLFAENHGTDKVGLLQNVINSRGVFTSVGALRSPESDSKATGEALEEYYVVSELHGRASDIID